MGGEGERGGEREREREVGGQRNGTERRGDGKEGEFGEGRGKGAERGGERRRSGRVSERCCLKGAIWGVVVDYDGFVGDGAAQQKESWAEREGRGRTGGQGGREGEGEGER